MADRPLRGTMIGCGFFAANHLQAWAEIEDVDLVAVCDREESKAAVWAERLSIDAVFADAERMLAETKPDFVDICTTVETHRPLVELAARHEIPAICQKPFAETWEDGVAMVEACRLAGVPLLIHENFRWQRPFIELQQQLKTGVIGTPHFARLTFRHGVFEDLYANQPYLKTAKHFAIMDVGIHLYDLARFLMGEVKDVACRTQRLHPEVVGEDAVVSTLGHESGAISVVDISFYAKQEPEIFPETLVWIQGEEGALELDRHYKLFVRKPGALEELDVDAAVPAWGERPWHVVQDSVINIQRHWVECLRRGMEP
ncbi:MAG: Gfo/Idh/MocA family oxidoreductase, partial [Pseudomonadota bacterium]